MKYKDDYLQVDHDFLNQLEEMKKEGRSGKVHFFNPEGEVDDAQGQFSSPERNIAGEWIKIDKRSIRLDKIITILGKPGPAYEEYDRYANACLTCEDPDQF